jgi:hypothetical protein
MQHARLTEDQAIPIFELKALLISSTDLAPVFDVSEKTVRDMAELG